MKLTLVENAVKRIGKMHFDIVHCDIGRASASDEGVVTDIVFLSLSHCTSISQSHFALDFVTLDLFFQCFVTSSLLALILECRATTSCHNALPCRSANLHSRVTFPLFFVRNCTSLAYPRQSDTVLSLLPLSCKVK
jgi:hypothetical protein